MKLALYIVETGLYPLIEWTNGTISNVRRLKEFKLVEDYLKPQRRFAHLFRHGGEEALKAVQEYANANIKKYGLQR